MARPKVHDAALRNRLLDRAGTLLSAEGLAGLSLRRLATEVGTSTTAVYSLFGGKQELLDAVYAEGFNRLGARLDQVPQTDDPAEDIVQLGLIYRQSAVTDPQFYLVMFNRAIPGFVPSDAAIEVANQTFSVVVRHVRRAIDLAVFSPHPSAEVAAIEIAASLWGLVHGLVSLELGVPLPTGVRPADLYERAIRAQTAGWRRLREKQST